MQSKKDPAFKFKIQNIFILTNGKVLFYYLILFSPILFLLNNLCFLSDDYLLIKSAISNVFPGFASKVLVEFKNSFSIDISQIIYFKKGKLKLDNLEHFLRIYSK